MDIDLAFLEQHLAASRTDVENSRVILHRAEGMVLLLEHLVARAKAPNPPEDPKPNEVPLSS